MTNQELFLHKALAAAKAARTKGPHRFCPVIAAAQSCLESAWGQSQLATRANNLKGQKAPRNWQGEVLELPTKEQRPDGTWYTTVARWCVFRDWAHAFEEYGRLVERVYPHAAAVADNPRAFLEALTSGTLKYATDQSYTQKVWSIVEQYQLLEPAPEPAPTFAIVIILQDGSQQVIPVSTPDSIVNRTDMHKGRHYIRLE